MTKYSFNCSSILSLIAITAFTVQSIPTLVRQPGPTKKKGFLSISYKIAIKTVFLGAEEIHRYVLTFPVFLVWVQIA
jgi:hypothetical protein